jgi:hypothetical protein
LCEHLAQERDRAAMLAAGTRLIGLVQQTPSIGTMGVDCRLQGGTSTE